MKKYFFIKFFIIAIFLVSCFDTRSSKSDIINLIYDKTDLKISDNFNIILDSVQHTQGAFDSDYSYYLVIEYKSQAEKNIIGQIITSEGFNKTDDEDSKIKKGVWIESKNGFEFIQSVNDLNIFEPVYVTVDTLTNKIELNLTHL